MPHLPNLRKIREAKFLTQRDLAIRSGVTEVTISRIETGRHQATLTTARKLAEALGVEPSALVGA